MSSSYQLEIMTPEGTAYQGEVVHVLIPAEDGFVGVLAHHAPYITSSSGGRFDIRQQSGEERQFQVGSGFFEVANNQAIFLTQSCHPMPGVRI
jgi:F-type H+-transporting ATPase subunit epsilon